MARADGGRFDGILSTADAWRDVLRWLGRRGSPTFDEAAFDVYDAPG